MNIEELEVLRPLLESLPPFQWGKLLVGGDFDKAICLSCGAMDDMIMIREHRPDCAYKAHWRAIDALQRMLPVTCTDCGVILPCKTVEHREGCSALM